MNILVYLKEMGPAAYVLAAIFVLDIVLLLLLLRKFRRNKRNDVHRNGTDGNGARNDRKVLDRRRFDEDGYDIFGYDRHGYDRQGYDRLGYNKAGFNSKGFNAAGYDVRGFNAEGYNCFGKNAKGQYDRLQDKAAFSGGQYSVEGFLSTRIYPVRILPHAKERMSERMGITSEADMVKRAIDAYRFGKSSRQVMHSVAAKMQEKEHLHEGSVVLLYRNYVYIFSRDNCLITVYPNENFH